MVSQDAYDKVKSLIDGAQNVLVCINNRASLDTHLAAAAVVKYIGAGEKGVSVCTNGDLIRKHKELFDMFGIEYNEGNSPKRYVITVDHAEGGIERVSYDDVDGKFHLYITPSDGAPPFDFDNVSYSEGGGDADLILAFGFRNISWLGDIYEERKELFDAVPVVSINDLPGEQELGNIQLVDTEISVSEIVYTLFDGRVSDERFAEILLTGLVDHLQPLQRNDYRIRTVETMLKLIKAGADLKSAFRSLYFSRSLENLEMVRRVMNNVKLDAESEIIWSTVSRLDLSQSGVNRDNFMLDGRIVFNISRDFRVAFVIYEVAEGEIVVECESNDEALNVEDLLHEYKVAGDEARAYCTVRDKTLAEVESEVLEMITPVMGVSSVPQESAGISIPEGIEGKSLSGKALTADASTLDNAGSGQKSVKNGSQQDERLVTPPPVNPEKAR